MTGSTRLALDVRCHALRMVHRARSSHIGSCLSIADILAVLYTEVLRIDPAHPADPDRDRFILSKGHAAAAAYAVLAERGFFPLAWLDDYAQDGSPLMGHVSHHVPGVELYTGQQDRVGFDDGGDGIEAGLRDPGVDQVKFGEEARVEMLFQGFQHHRQRQHIALVDGAGDADDDRGRIQRRFSSGKGL